jgi:tetratricopeptide (TPR) repeat protein
MRTIALASATAFAVTLAVLSLTGRDAARPRPVAPAAVAHGASTDAQIGALQARVRNAPADPDGYTLLASRFLQKVRETGDPGFYARADRALRRALALDPRNAGALTERGALRLSRHDFVGALRDGRLAHRLAPDAVRPYGVIVDANVELGRLPAATRTLQRMIDLKPDLAAYARVSYLRELRGDLRGARSAMALAVASGAASPENAAYVNTLLGDLELGRGRRAAAQRAYDEALRQFPGYVRAQAGTARVAAARGDLPRALRTLRDVVRATQRLFAASGANVDLELALFEADHGSPARALSYAESAYRARPQSVLAEDAYAWALYRAGRAQQALRVATSAQRLGTRLPYLRYHLGVIAAAAGERRTARTALSQALALNPSFNPLQAPAARRLLRSLS